ncbi:hypothetical protein THC_1345 [Caldimicrobium thiodismutans]|uniref:TRAM domain-containing protein n=1 Tax=Caldimicrobium thiodismutans TaxID=1653476 RepID=A0A0U5B6K1_9BACT|nr:23S rRNA (uracil(1939)-C(5))-methyltransferase RlmD [Caldimicrobium thiodismutans]BAU23712.1 hypothetical protein THC_1345 [Caldimicrobium thiodismutans]
MKQFDLKIEKMVFGGEGLGRSSSGKVVFVPYTLPGELVRVGIYEEYRDYARGMVLEVLEASPHRINPPCRYYGLCGGCQFQHATYEEELRIKERVLKDLFFRQGYKREIPLRGIIPSEKIYHYRNRLRLHVENHILKMGFVKKGTHEVLKIEECLLGEDILNELLKELYAESPWINMAFYIKRIKLESSPLDGKATLLFWTSLSPRREELEQLCKLKTLKSIFYLMKGARPVGPFPEDAPFAGRRLFASLSGLIYYIQPGVFTQTNWEINLKIMQKIGELTQGTERILDLHSGMGNFLIPLVKGNPSAKAFLGVDTDIRAIEDGLFTAEKNNLDGRLELRRMSAMEALYEAVQSGEKYDLVLLDPPRGGCKELLRLLPDVAEDKILYLSCDAPTLVRDIILLEKAGFTLSEIYLFDMFPRTYHFEVLALLQKIN